MLLIVFLLVMVADVWLMKILVGQYDWILTVLVVLASTLVGLLFIRSHRKQINWSMVAQWNDQDDQLNRQIHDQLQQAPAKIPAEHRELAITHIQISAMMPALLLILLPGIITDVLGMLVVLHARFMVSHLKSIQQSAN